MKINISQICDDIMKDKIVRRTTPAEDAKVEEAIKRRKAFDTGRAAAKQKYIDKFAEESLKKKSYSLDFNKSILERMGLLK